MGNKQHPYPKRWSLKVDTFEKIYLEEYLTPAQVADRKENMNRVLVARNNGKWTAYKEHQVIIKKNECMTAYDIGEFAIGCEDTLKNTVLSCIPIHC
jgi:hypothetical protein